MRRTALTGHRLEGDGGADGYHYQATMYPGLDPGRAVCQCGTRSEVLPSVAARRRWHAGHKDEVRAQGGSEERGAGVHAPDDVPVAWRPPKGGKLRARLNRHAKVTGWPVNALITEAVRRFLDEEAPTPHETTTGDTAMSQPRRTRASFFHPPRNPLPTHRYAGSSKDRQEVGLPGHCEPCAQVGHVKAHKHLGCGDVGCNSAHGPDEEAAAGA